MLARQRMLALGSATLVALVSGGGAWAATNGSTGGQHSTQHVHTADITDSSTSSTDSTDTMVTDSSTTSSTDTTDTTDTTVGDSTTTSMTQGNDTTTTSVAPTTPTSQPCKPGWGYGDKNHCHSGPPGQNKKHHQTKH
jgi:hypothetical protein